MKPIFLTLLFLAAGRGETTARIPFPFFTGGTTMPPGEYRVDEISLGSTNYLKLEEVTSREVMVLGESCAKSGQASEAALRFRCGADGCALVAYQPDQRTFCRVAASRPSKSGATDRLIALGK